MNPLEMIKKAMAEKESKKGKKPAMKKPVLKEGSAAEEAKETPEEAAIEASQGKSDTGDLYKGKK